MNPQSLTRSQLRVSSPSGSPTNVHTELTNGRRAFSWIVVEQGASFSENETASKSRFRFGEIEQWWVFYNVYLYLYLHCHQMVLPILVQPQTALSREDGHLSSSNFAQNFSPICHTRTVYIGPHKIPFFSRFLSIPVTRCLSFGLHIECRSRSPLSSSQNETTFGKSAN